MVSGGRWALAAQLEPALLDAAGAGALGCGVAVVEGGCAVLVADISGFSAAEALLAGVKGGTDTFQAVLNAALGGLEAVVARHGGVVVHVAGDALLCAFVDEGDRRGAAAAAAQEIVDTFNTEFRLPRGGTLPLAVHGAVGVGDLSVVSVGDPRCRQLTMCGPALDRALRLSELATRDQMLVQASEDGAPPELLERRGKGGLGAPAAQAGKGTNGGQGGRARGRGGRSAGSAWPYLHQFYLMHAGGEAGAGAGAEAGEGEGPGLRLGPGRVDIDIDVDAAPLSGVYDLATVFIQFSSFDVASHGAGLDLARLDAAYRAAVSECRAFGGLVDILLADDKGFVFKAVFGLADLHDDFEVKAAVFALRARDALGALGVDCRIGCASGSAFCGFVHGASGTWSGWTMLGSRAVTLAARLMTMAAPNSILVSGSVAERSEGHVELARVDPPLAVKGLGLVVVFEAKMRRQVTLELPSARHTRDVDLGSLQDIADDASVADTSAVGTSERSGGRGERRQFAAGLLQDGVREALESVMMMSPAGSHGQRAGGTPSLGLAFVGEVGAGKSHCLSVAERMAEEAGMAVTMVRSTGVDAGVPLALARSLLSACALLAKGTDAASSLDGDYARALEVFGRGGPRGPAKVWEVTKKEDEVASLADSIASILGALCPLAVVMDDITFADDTSLLVLKRVLGAPIWIGRERNAKPLFLLSCTHRGAARPLVRDLLEQGILEHRLDPLPQDACVKLLRTFVPTGIEESIEREASLSGGSPAYLVEVGRALRRRVSAGAIIGDVDEENPGGEGMWNGDYEDGRTNRFDSDEEEEDEDVESEDEDEDDQEEEEDEGATYRVVDEKRSSLRRSLQVRLRKLTRERLLDITPAHVTLLKVASCIFGVFSAQDIVAMLPPADGDAAVFTTKVKRVLEKLERDGILYYSKSGSAEAKGQETMFTFASSIVSDTLYAGLLARQKREFHLRYALYLSDASGMTKRGGVGLGRDAALAMHWRHAGELELAIPLYLYAGRAAVDAGFVSDGVNFYVWAARCASKIGIPNEELGEMETRIAVLLATRLIDYGRACKHALKAMELLGVPFPTDRILDDNDVWRLGFCLTFGITSIVPHCQRMSSRPDRFRCAALAAWSSVVTAFVGVVQTSAVRIQFEKRGQDPNVCRAYCLLMSGLLSLTAPRDAPEFLWISGLLGTLRFVGKGALADAASERALECEELTAGLEVTFQPHFVVLGYARSVHHLFEGVNQCNAGRWADGSRRLRLARESAASSGFAEWSAIILIVQAGIEFDLVDANSGVSSEYVGGLMNELALIEGIIQPGFTRAFASHIRILFEAKASILWGGDGVNAGLRRRSVRSPRSPEETARTVKSVTASLCGEYMFSPWFGIVSHAVLFHAGLLSAEVIPPWVWTSADRFVQGFKHVPVEGFSEMHLLVFIPQLVNVSLVLWYFKDSLVPTGALVANKDAAVRPVLSKLMQVAEFGMQHHPAYVLRLSLAKALLGEALGTLSVADADADLAKAVASHSALRKRVGTEICGAEDMWLHDIAHFRARALRHNDDDQAEAWAHPDSPLYVCIFRYAPLFVDPILTRLLTPPVAMPEASPGCCG